MTPPTFKDRNRWTVIKWLMSLLTLLIISSIGATLTGKDPSAVNNLTVTLMTGILGILTVIYATKPSTDKGDLS